MLKLFKSVVGIICLYLMLFAGSTPFAGCTKTIYDTVIKRDTIISRDTLRLHDTSECSNLTDGLVAYYTFTNGSLKDSSGNNNHIYSNTAVATADRFGRANNAFDFNSVNHLMRVRNSASLNPDKEISIMAIVKPRAFYAGPCHGNSILGKGNRDDSKGFYYMRLQDSGSRCTPGEPLRTDKEFFSSGYGDNSPLGKGAQAGTDTAHIKANQWYTVIYTFDGIVSKLYVNGILKDVKLLKVTFTPNTNDLVIGRHDDANFPYPFNGVMDEIRIYNKALCPEQVAGLNDLNQ
jgi:hypothetical protein